MRSALKVMPPILLCCSMTSEVDVGGMAVEVEHPHWYSITFCCRDGSRGALTKWPLTWKCIRSKGESLNSSMWEKKPAVTDILQHLLNIYGAQTVDVSTVRWQVANFSSGNSDMKNKPHSRQPCRFLQACYCVLFICCSFSGNKLSLYIPWLHRVILVLFLFDPFHNKHWNSLRWESLH